MHLRPHIVAAASLSLRRGARFALLAFCVEHEGDG